MPIPGLFPPPLPCPVEATASAMAAHTSAALAAYTGASVDLVEFYSQAAAAQRVLGCVREEVSGAQAAELMEVLAILSFIQKDPAGAEVLLRAARLSAPQASLPEALLSGTPTLKPIQSRANAAQAPAQAPLPKVEGVQWQVNGAVSDTAPQGLPYLLQVTWKDGEVHWTGLIPTGGAPDPAVQLSLVPMEPKIEIKEVIKTVEVEKVCPRSTPPPLWLTASALGSTALAAGLYGFAVHTDNVFWSADTDQNDLEGLTRRSQALQWTAAGVGAVGLSLDVTLGLKLAHAFKEP